MVIRSISTKKHLKHSTIKKNRNQVPVLVPKVKGQMELRIHPHCSISQDKIFNIPSIDENDYNAKIIKIIKIIISIISNE